MLAIVDGITEAMSMHGWNPLDNVEVAHFNGLVVRPLTNIGAAAVSLDHVKKENDPRYAIGGIYKLNAVSGAGFKLINKDPFGVGMTGGVALQTVPS
jgi:hypothetical protein